MKYPEWFLLPILLVNRWNVRFCDYFCKYSIHSCSVFWIASYWETKSVFCCFLLTLTHGAGVWSSLIVSRGFAVVRRWTIQIVEGRALGREWVRVSKKQILNKEAQEEAVSSFSFRQLNMMSCFLLFNLFWVSVSVSWGYKHPNSYSMIISFLQMMKFKLRSSAIAQVSRKDSIFVPSEFRISTPKLEIYFCL